MSFCVGVKVDNCVQSFQKNH